MDQRQVDNDASSITSYVIVVMEAHHKHVELYKCNASDSVEVSENTLSLLHVDGHILFDRTEYSRVISSTSLEKALTTLDRMSDTEGIRREVIVMGELDVIEQQILSDRNSRKV